MMPEEIMQDLSERNGTPASVIMQQAAYVDQMIAYLLRQ